MTFCIYRNDSGIGSPDQRMVRVKVSNVVLGCTAYLGGLGGLYYYFIDLGDKERAKEATQSATAEAEGRPKNPATVTVPGRPLTESERLAIFSKSAPRYDSDIGFDETVMGLNLLRRWMLRTAKGDVLEVGGGTGRNLDYYPEDARLVLTDASEGMVQQTEKKLRAKKKADVMFGVMDASKLTFKDRSFDHVVDTFGLCSFEDPVTALREMERVCREDGKILLLEHGKSHYDWLNKILDKNLHKHVERWGCIWNRDIEELVKEAGLQIESISRFHFGTTYAITARPKGKSTSAGGI